MKNKKNIMKTIIALNLIIVLLLFLYLLLNVIISNFLYEHKSLNEINYLYTLKDSLDPIEAEEVPLKDYIPAYDIAYEYVTDKITYDGVDYEIGYVNKACNEIEHTICYYGYFKNLKTNVEGISPLSDTLFTNIYKEGDTYILEGRGRRTNGKNGKLAQGHYNNLKIVGKRSNSAYISVKFDAKGNILSEIDYIDYSTFESNEDYTLLTTSNPNYSIIKLNKDGEKLNEYTLPSKYHFVKTFTPSPRPTYDSMTSYETKIVKDNKVYLYVEDYLHNLKEICLDESLNVIYEKEITPDQLIETNNQSYDVYKNTPTLVEKYNLKELDYKFYEDDDYFYTLSYDKREVEKKINKDGYKFVKKINLNDYLEKKYSITLSGNNYYLFEKDDQYKFINSSATSSDEYKPYTLTKKEVEDIQKNTTYKTMYLVLEDEKIKYRDESYVETHTDLDDENQKEINIFEYKDKVIYIFNSDLYYVTKDEIEDMEENIILKNLSTFNYNILYYEYKDDSFYIVDSEGFNYDREKIEDLSEMNFDMRYKRASNDFETLYGKQDIYKIKIEDITGNIINIDIPYYSSIEPEYAALGDYIYIVNNISNSTIKELYKINQQGEIVEYITFDAFTEDAIDIESFTHERSFIYYDENYDHRYILEW